MTITPMSKENLVAYLKNFIRMGLIIGIVFCLFILAIGMIDGTLQIEIMHRSYTGIIAAVIIVIGTPIVMAINGLLFGLISYLPYKLIEKLTLKIGAWFISK